MAIKRVWHGWTIPENADKYQKLLHDEVFPGIEAKNKRWGLLLAVGPLNDSWNSEDS